MARAKKSRSKISELEGQADPRAPLDAAGLLAACQGVLVRLEVDLLERARSSPAVTRALEARYQAEKTAERTAESLAGWTQLVATQVAAAWILSCVFVRTLEDRGLLKQARLAGPGAEDSQRQFFQLAPSLTERDYLLTVFRELAHHPAARDLFDERHSPVWKLSPSAAAAQELVALFRTPDATAPAFRFGQSSTRFLGDLYQDLSEDVRKRYALLQTPDFIESFILDRTLEPAIQRFGLDDTTLIDPTCGSGHFLLGAFDRLFDHRLRAEPGIDPRGAAVKALDCVYGADINPYAVAIARFRLTLSFLDKAGYGRLADAPALPLHLVVADSLRINPQHAQAELWQQEGVSSQGWLGEAFTLEDEKAARDVLFRQYAAVVGNPPYITVKDAAMREVYRKMYKAASGKYALSAPFCERFFQLTRSRGYTGQITANSFMKREFGTRLIEDVLPAVNLEFIVNTSGAYIPGHGTPTIIIFGTKESPQGSDVLAVLAKRGEPSTPSDPSQGDVWCSIVENGTNIGFDNSYISVARISRGALAKHPWSLGGGGSSELKELLDERCAGRLSNVAESIGFMAITGEDEVFARPKASWLRLGAEPDWILDFCGGEDVRDWALDPTLAAAFPYREAALQGPEHYPKIAKLLWPYRRLLLNRPDFGGKKYIDVQRTWYEYHQVPLERLKKPWGIVFAFVATHNHFVLDRGGGVFKQTAPVIKLSRSATEDDYYALLAYLNSSVAWFWCRQVMANRGYGADAGNARTMALAWEDFYEIASGLLEDLPLFMEPSLVAYGRAISSLAVQRRECEFLNGGRPSSREQAILSAMVCLQEELDWEIYRITGLIDQATAAKFETLRERAIPGFAEALRTQHLETVEVGLLPGQRPFEVLMARQSALEIDEWFAKNAYAKSDIVTGALSALVLSRVDAIASIKSLCLVESPEFKRRWRIRQPAQDVLQYAEQRCCVCLEQAFGESVVVLHVSELVRRASFADNLVDIQALLRMESVPAFDSCIYTDSGQLVRKQWLACWDAQRRQDKGEDVEVLVPPRYTSKDYLSPGFFRLRGKVDVPDERFISYPGCESDVDGEPVYGWAGWDHLQRAKALATLYLNRRDQEGWTADRLTPMLAGLLELIPWVKQWHNEPSEEFGGLRMGDYYEQFFDGECRRHGKTHDDLRAWRPAKKARGGGKAAAKGKAARTEPEPAEAGAGNGPPGEEAAAPKKRRTKKQSAPAGGPPASEEAE